MQINNRPGFVKSLSNYLAMASFGFASLLILLGFLTWLGFMSTICHYCLGLDEATQQLGYFIFPLMVFSAFLSIFAHSYKIVRAAWKRRLWKWLSGLSGLGYGLFYIFATSTVSTPDAGSLTGLSFSSYVAQSSVYGPFTVWPDIEFYSQALNLSGYFSVGNILLIVSLSVLASFAAAVMILNLAGSRRAGKGFWPFTGTVVATLSTNTCCCCLPVIWPVASALFGGSVEGSLYYYLSGSNEPFSDLLATASIASLLVSILLATRTCAGPSASCSLSASERR